ncbi:hypothetical protein [Flavobacterium lindanitolerans]|nr:hypothetical protein [Flavobacterium lindanitolerans]
MYGEFAGITAGVVKVYTPVFVPVPSSTKTTDSVAPVWSVY